MVCGSILIEIPFIKNMLLFLGLDTYPIQITSLEVKPNPPEPGQELTVIVDGIATETVEVGLVLKLYISELTLTGRSICGCVCEDWIN